MRRRLLSSGKTTVNLSSDESGDSGAPAPVSGWSARAEVANYASISDEARLVVVGRDNLPPPPASLAWPEVESPLAARPQADAVNITEQQKSSAGYRDPAELFHV